MQKFLGESLFFGAAVSLLCYELGLILKKRFRAAVFNPLIIAIIGVIAVLKLLKIDYADYSASGKYLSYFLTPATVCLAVPLYEQMALLRRHFTAVILGIVSGVFSSLFGVLLLSKLFQMNRQLSVSLLPKSITTAIGMGMSEEMGGIAAITVSVIVITGVLGNIVGETVLKRLRIEEPIARGLALGTASHAIGTAKAMELGQTEGAMSSLSIVVSGLLTVVLAPVFAGML